MRSEAISSIAISGQMFHFVQHDTGVYRVSYSDTVGDIELPA